MLAFYQSFYFHTSLNIIEIVVFNCDREMGFANISVDSNTLLIRSIANRLEPLFVRSIILSQAMKKKYVNR
jgi:hypothetical protein